MKCSICGGPKMMKDGLYSKVTVDGKDSYVSCPVKCVTNPRTEKATLNVIRNNGRDGICQANPWKWNKI